MGATFRWNEAGFQQLVGDIERKLNREWSRALEGASDLSAPELAARLNAALVRVGAEPNRERVREIAEMLSVSPEGELYADLPDYGRVRIRLPREFVEELIRIAGRIAVTGQVDFDLLGIALAVVAWVIVNVLYEDD